MNAFGLRTAILEAATGRYDVALAMLPKLEGEQACELRYLLIDLILHEQGKTFGRLGSSKALALLGDY